MKKMSFLLFVFIFSCNKNEGFKRIDFEIKLGTLGGLTKWEGYIVREGKNYKLKVYHLIKKIRENPLKMETLSVVEKNIDVDSFDFKIDLKNFKQSKVIKECFSGITDFYPNFYFKIVGKDTIEIISKSNCRKFAPWNIKYREKIYVDEEGEIYDFVKKILEKGEIPLKGEGLPEKLRR